MTVKKKKPKIRTTPDSFWTKFEDSRNVGYKDTPMAMYILTLDDGRYYITVSSKLEIRSSYDFGDFGSVEEATNFLTPEFLNTMDSLLQKIADLELEIFQVLRQE